MLFFFLFGINSPLSAMKILTSDLLLLSIPLSFLLFSMFKIIPVLNLSLYLGKYFSSIMNRSNKLIILFIFGVVVYGLFLSMTI